MWFLLVAHPLPSHLRPEHLGHTPREGRQRGAYEQEAPSMISVTPTLSLAVSLAPVPGRLPEPSLSHGNTVIQTPHTRGSD